MRSVDFPLLFVSVAGLRVWLYTSTKKPSGTAVGRDCGFRCLVSSLILGVIHVLRCPSHALPVFKGILKVSTLV